MDKINAAYELAEGFTTIQSVLHIVSVAVIAVLLVVSLLIISNTVKLAMYDRRDEIAIMKMVGATNGFIRLPFVVEGFSSGHDRRHPGLRPGLAGYDAMLNKISSVDALQLFNFVPFQELLLPMVATFAAAGMFVGIVAAGLLSESLWTYNYEQTQRDNREIAGRPMSGGGDGGEHRAGSGGCRHLR